MITAMRFCLLGMLFCIVAACALNEAQTSVAKSQGADIGSTALGLSMGFSEANPLGLALLPIKAYVVNQADCETVEYVNTISYSATGYNIALIAGINPFIGIPVAIGLYFTNKKPCRTMKERVADEFAIYYGIPE